MTTQYIQIITFIYSCMYSIGMLTKETMDKIVESGQVTYDNLVHTSNSQLERFKGKMIGGRKIEDIMWGSQTISVVFEDGHYESHGLGIYGVERKK